MSTHDSLASPPPTRREFCAHACRAVSLLAVGSIVGCGGNPNGPSGISVSPAPQVSGSVSGRTISVQVDSTSTLATVGNGALVQTPLGTFLVARTGQDTFSAMTGVCTHENNIVSGFAGGRFVCPVHGSQFTTSGAVVTGPASASLRQFATQFTGGTLTFTV